MFSHTPQTIAKQYSLLGQFCVPGIQGKFEVRSHNGRKTRPLLIVVHESWERASRRERVAPVSVVELEANGEQHQIQQDEALPGVNTQRFDFSQMALEFFHHNHPAQFA